MKVCVPAKKCKHYFIICYVYVSVWRYVNVCLGGEGYPWSPEEWNWRDRWFCEVQGCWEPRAVSHFFSPRYKFYSLWYNKHLAQSTEDLQYVKNFMHCDATWDVSVDIHFYSCSGEKLWNLRHSMEHNLCKRT